ncbi:unnamed protein product, partial [Rotaria sp. Silwood2]
METLSFLKNQLQIDDDDEVNESDNDDPSNSTEVRINTQTLSTTRKPTTFDDDESQESDRDELVNIPPREINKNSNHNGLSEDSDEDLIPSSPIEIQNTSNSTSFSSRTNRLLSPSLAVRRIISAYSQNQNDAVPPAPPKTNSRIRIERQHGEVLTSGTLLNELREKAVAKATKTSKNKVAQQTQSSAKKKLNELSKCVLY